MYRIITNSLLLVMLGCKHDPVIVPPLPVIEINTPLEKDHFYLGDTIVITGKVSHNILLTEVAVHMTRLNDNTEFFHNHYSPINDTVFSFSCKYKIDNTLHTAFEVEVEARDKDNKESKKEVEVAVN
jgi:hypothetical protein